MNYEIVLLIPLDQLKVVDEMVKKAQDLGEVWRILSPFIKLQEIETNTGA